MKKKLLFSIFTIISIFTFSFVALCASPVDTYVLNYNKTSFCTFQLIYQNGQVLRANGQPNKRYYKTVNDGGIEIANMASSQVPEDVKITFTAESSGAVNPYLFTLEPGNYHFKFETRISYQLFDPSSPLANFVNVPTAIFFIVDNTGETTYFYQSSVLWDGARWSTFTYDRYFQVDDTRNIVTAGLWFPNPYNSANTSLWTCGFSPIQVEQFILNDANTNVIIQQENIISGDWSTDKYKQIAEIINRDSNYSQLDGELFETVEEFFKEFQDGGRDILFNAPTQFLDSAFMKNNLTLFSRLLTTFFSEIDLYTPVVAISVSCGLFLTLTGLASTIVGKATKNNNHKDKKGKGE